MDPKSRNCFLFLLPYVVATFLTRCAMLFFTPEATNPFTTFYSEFVRLNAFENLSPTVCVVALYALVKHTRDKLILAFSIIVIFSFYGISLVKLLLGYHYHSMAIFVCLFSQLIAICVACLWMLVRINRVKKVANAAIISAIALIAPFVIREIPTRPTALTEFLSGEIFWGLWGYATTIIVPVVILGLYLRYCAEPHSAPAQSHEPSHTGSSE